MLWKAFTRYGLAGTLFSLWLINLTLFIVHFTDTTRRDTEFRANEGIEALDKRPGPCPSPYGPDIVDNIRRVLGKPTSSNHARDYMKFLGLDTLSIRKLKLLNSKEASEESKTRIEWTPSILKQSGWNSKATTDQQYPTIVLAASSNHFQEIQSLFHNLHTVVNTDGRLKVVFFDLGLTPQEHDLMVRHCRCEVRYFQFSRLPSHVRDVNVFSWKPILIQQAVLEFRFVMYMDASIRLLSGDLQELFDSARNQGILVIRADHDSFTVVEHTDPRTFAFLGEKPCYFDGIPERQAGFILMTDNIVIQYAIMVPWLECALSQECIAPQGSRDKWFCSFYRHFYGKCHRYDQSVLNIVLSRIYHNDTIPTVPRKFYQIDRNDKMNYFETS